jgi:hypothetical protein
MTRLDFATTARVNRPKPMALSLDWSKLDLDARTTQILQAAIDWQYLIVCSGGMARKSVCEAWLIQRFGIDDYHAHWITNMITEGPRCFMGSDWFSWIAHRPAPKPDDYPDIDYTVGEL